MQQIENPHGVTVYGSHVLRVRPDRAVISVAITRTAAEPADAFRDARQAMTAVRDFLHSAKVGDRDVHASEIQLQTEFRRVGKTDEFVGHVARVEINLTVDELSQVEPLLVGMVEAGADRVRRVSFVTTALREHRATARKQAVAAARAKAELYCEVAGVKLGKVLHIEDVDPTRGRRGYGHVVDTDVAEDADGHGAYDPGAITVVGAVTMSFALL